MDGEFWFIQVEKICTFVIQNTALMREKKMHASYRGTDSDMSDGFIEYAAPNYFDEFLDYERHESDETETFLRSCGGVPIKALLKNISYYGIWSLSWVVS